MRRLAAQTKYVAEPTSARTPQRVSAKASGALAMSISAARSGRSNKFPVLTMVRLAPVSKRTWRRTIHFSQDDDQGLHGAKEI